MSRTLPEIKAHLRAVIANGSISTTLIQTEDLALLCDAADALKNLSDMYSSAWDLVDGGLMMMESSIPRFEEAQQAARKALGFNDLPIDDQE